MVECSDFPHAYDNPSSVNSLVRAVSRLPSYTHHRTPSNVSNTSTSSNVNPIFHLENDSEYLSYSTNHYYQRLPNAGATNFPSFGNHEYTLGPQEHLIRHNCHDLNSTMGERPGNLEVVTRLRSSLKKANYAYNSPNKNTSKNNSGCGTPTNHTPPDSLTSEDSSYVSAKDSQISNSRVRFSPITFDRESIARDQFDVTTHGVGQDQITSSLQSSRHLSRHRKPSISDLDREFLS